MHTKILNYIKSQKLLSWAMIDETGVYTASAFYAFDEKNLNFIIASHENSKHIKLATQNKSIAVNIAKESKIPLLKGIQAKAFFKEASLEQIEIYYSKFNFARFDKSAKIYALEIFWAKFTDNSLLLGKKLEFKK